MFKSFDEVNKVLEKILIPENFGININEDDDSMLDDWSFEALPADVDLFHGCTKVAITKDNWDCVIKIGFNGKYETYYNEDEDEDYPEEEEVFEEYCSAPGSVINDYALAEYEAYCQLCEDGFGIIMPYMEYYGIINGHRVFLQKKVTTASQQEWDENRDFFSPSVDSLRYVKSRKPHDIICGVTWDANLIDKCGIDFYNSFVKYCNCHPLIKNDLHNDNFGYDENGMSIILDIGGYKED